MLNDMDRPINTARRIKHPLDYCPIIGMYRYEVTAEIADEMLYIGGAEGETEIDRVINNAFGPVPTTDKIEEIF